AMLPNGGPIKHYVATNLAEELIDETTNVYLAGGAFAAGTITEHGGRKAENLRAVMWLQFDADLSDFSMMDQEYLWQLPQEEIDRLIVEQRHELERCMKEVGLRIHRLDYTGYGLCAYIYLEPVQAPDI